VRTQVSHRRRWRRRLVAHHLDDAAAASVLAIDHDGPAVYNIVDDEPAPSWVWLPELAKIVGAKPPQGVGGQSAASATLALPASEGFQHSSATRVGAGPSGW
jgi:nucleoside-diphosphate-sugar epimerase